MKKILYCITKSNWGGAQRYVYDLATHLSADFEIAVALGGDGELRQRLEAHSIRTIPIMHLGRDVRLLSDIRVFFELFRIFLREKPDIVHLNSSKMAFLGAPAGRLSRIPRVIFTAHGWPFNEERPRWQTVVLRAALWFALLLPHRIIAVSNAVKNDTRKFPFVASKTVVIRNGVEPLRFLTRDESRGRLIAIEGRLAAIPPGAPWICINAELHRSKGIPYAVQAAQMLADKMQFALCIIGRGEDYAALKAHIKDAGLENRVFLLGFIEDAATYLNAFNLFLLPSVTEALGYVLLEAGLAELPVIATQVGGIPEIIEHKKTGLLVEPRDPNAIARAIEWILNNRADAINLGIALNRRVHDQFSLGCMREQTAKLYCRS